MTKNSGHDDYIVANYKSLGPTVIARVLGIPKGSVITRYGIATGKRIGHHTYRCDKPRANERHERLSPPVTLPSLKMDR